MNHFRIVVFFVITLSSAMAYSSVTKEQINENSECHVVDFCQNQWFSLHNPDSTAVWILRYKNGQMRKRLTESYHPTGVNYKQTEEFFRRTGQRKYTLAWNWDFQLAYRADYSKDGELVLKRTYIYDDEGTLTSIETWFDGKVTRAAIDQDIEPILEDECEYFE